MLLRASQFIFELRFAAGLFVLGPGSDLGPREELRQKTGGIIGWVLIPALEMSDGSGRY
jgi:hypothetical protein